MKTNTLTGAALDWAVAQAEGKSYVYAETDYTTDGRTFQRGTAQKQGPHYSTDWAQGGPIIEREGINTIQSGDWIAEMDADHSGGVISTRGDTPLIAAMRCYVISKLGDEIELPEDLNKEQA